MWARNLILGALAALLVVPFALRPRERPAQAERIGRARAAKRDYATDIRFFQVQ